METKEKETLKNIPDEVCNKSIVKDFYDEKKDKNKEPKNQIEKIINYLNEKSHKNFRSTTEKTIKLIKVRLNENYTFDDFKKVIDIKTMQWINNKEFKKFLRPETLFGNKFEGYLNEGKTETDKDFNMKRAEDCYKKCKGDCLVSGTIRLETWCDYCVKVKSQTLQLPFKEERSEIILKEPLKKEISLSKELEIPNQTIKKFKYPYLLASYPFFKDSSKFYKLLVKHTIDEEESLENIAYGMYGEYKIISYRNPKLMDIKVLLVNIYLSDYFKSRRYEVSIKEFLEKLKLKSTGYYRNEILKSQHFLKNTTFITPIIDYKTGEKFGIHEWSILAEFKFHDEEKRKYHFEILLGDSFYKNIQKDYTLIELGKVLSLSYIALNLFLFLTTQSPSKLYKYPKDFDDLKIAIGITTKNITRSKQIFEKAWKDIKSKGLLKGYRKSEPFISKKDNREKIRFSKQKDLTP